MNKKSECPTVSARHETLTRIRKNVKPSNFRDEPRVQPWHRAATRSADPHVVASFPAGRESDGRIAQHASQGCSLVLNLREFLWKLKGRSTTWANWVGTQNNHVRR